MAEVQIRDILVGHGNLYAANYGQALPDLAEAASTNTRLEQYFDADAAWSFMGATQEGVELAYAPEYGEVEVDQLGDAAVMFFERSSVTMNTQLAEATLENLLIAWGFEDEYVRQTAGNEVTQFSIGVHGSDPTERTVAVVGKGAGATIANPDYVDATTTPNEPETIDVRRDRVYHGRRVLSIEGSSLALRRSENTAYPVSLRLLADPAFVNSEYGVIVDRIPGDATATPNPNKDEPA